MKLPNPRAASTDSVTLAQTVAGHIEKLASDARQRALIPHSSLNDIYFPVYRYLTRSLYDTTRDLDFYGWCLRYDPLDKQDHARQRALIRSGNRCHEWLATSIAKQNWRINSWWHDSPGGDPNHYALPLPIESAEAVRGALIYIRKGGLPHDVS